MTDLSRLPLAVERILGHERSESAPRARPSILHKDLTISHSRFT